MWTEAMVIASLIIFGAYICWYSFVGKTLQPLSIEEVGLMWRLHKKQTGCTGTRINDFVMSKGEVVGFRCECGYEFKQKRLLTQNAPKFCPPAERSEFSFQDYQEAKGGKSV